MNDNPPARWFALSGGSVEKKTMKMDFKRDIKVRIENNYLTVTYQWRGYDGSIRAYGKKMSIEQDCPIGIVEDFVDTCVLEIGIMRALAPGARACTIQDKVKWKQD